MCREEEACRDFSHFGPLGFPYPDSCFLFSDCGTLASCDDCFTESVGCSRFCSAPVQGVLGDNVIETLLDVSSETSCEEACAAEDQGRFSIKTFFWPLKQYQTLS